MMEAGLAGGAGTYALTGDPRQALEIGAGAAGLGAGAGATGLVRHGVITGAKTALGYVDRNTASKVAELLTSQDPSEINRGLRLPGRTGKLLIVCGTWLPVPVACSGPLRLIASVLSFPAA